MCWRVIIQYKREGNIMKTLSNKMLFVFFCFSTILVVILCSGFSFWWNKSNSFFEYHVHSFPTKGITVKIKTEADIYKLFDMRVFGKFVPPSKYLNPIPGYSSPMHLSYEETMAQYGDPISIDTDKLEYYYKTPYSRIKFSGDGLTVISEFSNFTVDSFILDNSLKSLVKANAPLRRIWLTHNGSNVFFCVINHSFIDSAYWSKHYF